MGTALTGTTPQDTYDSLIKVTDNGPLSGSLKVLSDGLGNDSTLSLSTTAAKVDGLLSVAAFTTSDLTNSTQLSLTRSATQFTGIAIRGSVAADRALFSVGSDDALHIGRHAGGGGAWAKQVSFLDNGNVGIGTSSPNARLDVGYVAGAVSLRVQRDANNILDFYQGGGISYIDSSPVGGQIVFSTVGVERLRVTANGLTFNGDTAAANALDDYEEGTWTMGVSFGGASVGVTTSQNTGTYTKIGRQVTVNGYLVLTGKGSSTGIAAITGLPFTIGNIGRFYSAPSLYFSSITFANQFQGYGNINTTTIALEETTILGVATAITDADFGSSSNLVVSFTYFV